MINWSLSTTWLIRDTLNCIGRFSQGYLSVINIRRVTIHAYVSLLHCYWHIAHYQPHNNNNNKKTWATAVILNTWYFKQSNTIESFSFMQVTHFTTNSKLTTFNQTSNEYNDSTCHMYNGPAVLLRAKRHGVFHSLIFFLIWWKVNIKFKSSPILWRRRQRSSVCLSVCTSVCLHLARPFRPRPLYPARPFRPRPYKI